MAQRFGLVCNMVGKPEIETPDTGDQKAYLDEAWEALASLRDALDSASDLRRHADEHLKGIGRPVLSYTKDCLAEALNEVLSEIDEIDDAPKRFEERT